MKMTGSVESIAASESPRSPATVAGWAPTGRTTAVLALTGMLVVGQMYAVLPLFAPMSRAFEVPADQLTWLATAFGIAYAFGFLICGPLADRYGRRRVITVGLVAFAVSTAAVAAATTLPSAITLRAVQGLTAATFAPAAVAYITEHVEPSRRAVAMTWLTSGFLAAAVVLQVFAQVLSAAAGWETVFLASAAVLASAAFAGRSLRKDTDRGRAVTARAAFVAMPRLLTRPRMLALYGATATLLGGFVTVYSAVALAGPPSVAGDPAALLVLRASALPVLLVLPVMTMMTARYGASRRITVGLATAAISALAASLVGGNVLALGVVLLAFVGGIGTAGPALMETIAARAEGSTRGAAVALYACVMFIGASLGPQLAGALAGLGFAAIVQAAAGFLAVGALLAAAGGWVRTSPPGGR